MFELNHRSKLIYAVCIGVIAFIILINISYHRWGHGFIESMYDGSVVGPLKTVISSQTNFPLEYYFAIGDEFVIGLNIFSSLYLLGFLIFSKVKTDFSKRILLNLLWADILFLIIHLSHNELWFITREFLLPEIFQYLKMLSLAVLFLLFFKKTHQKIYILLSGTFFYFFLDDSFRIHEYFSTVLSEKVKRVSISRSLFIDSGEIAEFLFAGFIGIFFVLMLLSVYRKSDQISRRITRNTIGFILLFSIFTLGFDTLCEIQSLSSVQNLFSVIEDWGEMVVMSFICFYITRCYCKHIKITKFCL